MNSLLFLVLKVNPLVTFLPIIIIFTVVLLVVYIKKRKQNKEDLINENNKGQSNCNLKDLRYSNFWIRLLAFIVDLLILLMVNGILSIMLNLELKDKIADFGFIAIFSHPIGILTGWLYYAFFESSKFKATLGKMLFKILVTDIHGNRIDFGTATGRYFGKILSSLILCIGFLMIFFMKRNQSLHDILAETVVIKKPKIISSNSLIL